MFIRFSLISSTIKHLSINQHLPLHATANFNYQTIINNGANGFLIKFKFQNVLAKPAEIMLFATNKHTIDYVKTYTHEAKEKK